MPNLGKNANLLDLWLEIEMHSLLMVEFLQQMHATRLKFTEIAQFLW